MRTASRLMLCACLLLCQDISTIIRWKLAPIIFLINNQGYTIEVEIHDGPYNYIHNWDYVALVEAIDNKQGNALCLRVCPLGCRQLLPWPTSAHHCSC